MSIEQLGQGLQQLTELLGADTLDPDPARQDWGVHADALASVVAVARDDVLAKVDTAVAELGEDEAAIAELRGAVADRLGDAAGLMFAAQRDDAARTFLAGARSVAGPGGVADLLEVGESEKLRFVRVIRAWWLKRHERDEEAVAVARQAAEDAPEVVAASMRHILEAPRKITAPPHLFSINGFGLRLYGAREHRDDGSYVTTRYATALFLPLLPVDAFRVVSAGDDGWYFLGKATLGALGTWWRRLALAGALVAVLGTLYRGYTNSENYRISEAIELAQKAEETAGPGGRAAVIDLYEKILVEFADAEPEKLRPVIEGFVRLSAADVESPLTVDHMAQVKEIALRYRALPDVARHQLLAGTMVGQLERWADELGTARQEEILAAIELLIDAEELASSDAEPRIRRRRNGLNRDLAAGLAEDWPLEAIRQYAMVLDDPEGVLAAGELLASLGDGPSQWIELAPTVQRWDGAAAAMPELAATRQEVAQRVAAAQTHAADPERIALLDDPDPDALALAIEASPGDQELVVALAGLKLRDDDVAGALDMLEAVGPPGRMVLGTQAALASVYADAGREAEADSLLERVLTSRLPAFASARRVYGERVEALGTRMVSRAQTGTLPPAIQAQIDAAAEADQQAIFDTWLDGQLEADVELAQLRDEYTALVGVVDIAIQWGTLKLRRAEAAEGEERLALLDGAQRAFLAIRQEGAGVPGYHLGLGQVYYRLGKEEAGERELLSLLDDEPPEIRLTVAATYRGLGLVTRAREVAEDVFDNAESPLKEAAALSLAVMANDREETRRWLRHADTTAPGVRLQLLELDAHDLLERGEYARADETFAEVAAGWSKQAQHDGTAANNAAIAMMARYGCTGDEARLREAVDTLDRARRLDPDNGLVVGNLAAAVDTLATVELLATVLPPRPLRLSLGDAPRLLEGLAFGPERAALVAAMNDSATLRRALDLVEQSQVLAPKDPWGYRSRLSWHVWRGEDEAIEALRARVEGGAAVDLSNEVASVADYVAGVDDEQTHRRLEQSLAHDERILAAVDAKRTKSTQAAARWLLASTQYDMATLGGDVEMARKAVATFAEGALRWNGIDSESEAWARVELALLEAKADSVPLAEAYDAHRRRLGRVGLMAWLLEEDGEALAALRARPELADAVNVRRTVGPERLQPEDWVLARVADDAELEAASRPALDRGAGRTRYELERRLSPQPEGIERALKLMNAGQ
jgi:hypothetical protein